MILTSKSVNTLIPQFRCRLYIRSRRRKSLVF